MLIYEGSSLLREANPPKPAHPYIIKAAASGPYFFLF